MAQKDAWRAYVELVQGLTETSRKKAMKIVQEVAGKGGATADQMQDLVTQGLANREAMTRMIRVELDRALGRVGLATMDEVEELNRRVRDLERELYATRVAAGMPTEPGVDGAAPAATVAKQTMAKKTVAKKAVAKKAVAKKAVASGGPAKAATASTGPAKKASAKKAPAKKASAKRAPAKKASAKRAPAKKASARKGTATAAKATSASNGSTSSTGRAATKKAVAKRSAAKKTARKTTGAGS